VTSGRAVESQPEAWSTVTILGLGVIGGSMARALRARLPGLRLIGVEREEVVAAVGAGDLVDDCLCERDEGAVERAFASSQLVFLAAPISGITRWLGRALEHAPLVTDCGSTKRELVRAARESPGASRFVPGHPMAGAGAAQAAAEPELFVGRPWLLCPEGVDPGALRSVERLVSLVGALPVHMSAAEHDRAVALTSHVPRLVASALTVLVERERAFAAGGPAFERQLRSAGGAPEMWRDVLRSNADEVARALRLMLAELEACSQELERGELGRSLGTLAGAEAARQRLKPPPSTGG
jgi:prephenate dehydrogenase